LQGELTICLTNTDDILRLQVVEQPVGHPALGNTLDGNGEGAFPYKLLDRRRNRIVTAQGNALGFNSNLQMHTGLKPFPTAGRLEYIGLGIRSFLSDGYHPRLESAWGQQGVNFRQQEIAIGLDEPVSLPELLQEHKAPYPALDRWG